MSLRNDHSSESSRELVPMHAPRQSGAAEPYIPGWLRKAEEHTLILDKHRLWASIQYAVDPWYRIPKAIIYWAGRGIFGALGEIRYVWSGGLRVIDGLYAWSIAINHERAAAVAVGTTHAYRGAERHVNVRSRRGAVLWAALGAVSILGLWLGIYYPSYGELAGIGLAAVLDAIGRRGRPKSEAPPHTPVPLKNGMPTSALKREIRIFLEEEGLDNAITVATVRFAPQRHAYYIDLVTAIAIKPELLRALEKRIYAPDRAIRIVVDPENAALQTLVVSTGNPLANVPEAPWIPAGTVSGWDPLDLGLSIDPTCPYELVLVMRNVLLVSRTRGGKSVTLSTIIDRLSATSDVVTCAGALIKSSIFDAWRSVIYKKAENVNQLTELLEWLIGQIQQRDRMLKDINSDDDPSNDVDKWNPSLGPAIVCVLDEFPWIAKYDGTKVHQDGKPNLLDMVETIMRTGSGLGVSLVLACQASGNEDWGSSVIYKQANVKIIGPCTERDTVDLLGKDKRDQGYAPHLLQPADEHNINDAGMAIVDGPGFGSDFVRSYWPFKVKARAIRREAEWAQLGNRPMLPIESHTAPAAYIDAEELPPALTAVEMALRHYGANILSSALVVKYANEQGDKWTQASLATALSKESPAVVVKARSGRCQVNKRPLQCYHREDVAAAIRARESSP